MSGWHKWVVTFLCDKKSCSVQHQEVCYGRCRLDCRDWFRLAHPSYTILDIEPTQE